MPKNYVEMDADFILDPGDGLHEVLSRCYENNTDALLLHGGSLPAAFFDISSRVAGEIMQKLSNYRIRTAILLDGEFRTSTLFSQMTSDANRFGMVRFFDTREAAEAWLNGG